MTTFVHFTVAFIQAQQPKGSSLVDLLWRASPIAKGVLILLLIFSVVSWAIIFSKWVLLKNVENSSREFLARFRKQPKLSDLYMEYDASTGGPLARIFLAGYDEIANQIGDGGGEVRSIDAVGRVLQGAVIAEVNHLEKSLTWLATTANASPFIGLFGTVVGIVIAFQGLSAASASSIQAVAPGIAEALIATAAGIAAAVPAAIFYNHFLSRVKALTAVMDRFSLDLLNLVERHYVKAHVR